MTEENKQIIKKLRDMSLNLDDTPENVKMGLSAFIEEYIAPIINNAKKCGVCEYCGNCCPICIKKIYFETIIDNNNIEKIYKHLCKDCGIVRCVKNNNVVECCGCNDFYCTKKCGIKHNDKFRCKYCFKNSNNLHDNLHDNLYYCEGCGTNDKDSLPNLFMCFYCKEVFCGGDKNGCNECIIKHDKQCCKYCVNSYKL
jgi:hypothetical protein